MIYLIMKNKGCLLCIKDDEKKNSNLIRSTVKIGSLTSEEMIKRNQQYFNSFN